MTPADMRAEYLADGEAAALEAMQTWRCIAQEAFHRLAEQQREIQKLEQQKAEMREERERFARQAFGWSSANE